MKRATSGATTDGVGCGLVVVAACDGQEELGAGDLDGWGSLGPTQLGEELLLLGGHLAKGRRSSSVLEDP
ncbi:hypothetical protein [Singulisphaera sp. GP187]|uniref:hypothetical protein n=1 Tax=Singulisphaera sp. GP187 TaxID=1882752 RepID=UPI001161081D|nr:hypothetical protein [Singulisphaera sp. GP187]